jgi:hypothetical protein
MQNTIQATAANPAASANSSRNTLDANLGAALEHARRLTAMYGIASSEVAVAWDVFEELLTAKARQTESMTLSPASGFAGYCALNPDAPECRVYDL